jgi:hypothetical protein
VFFKTIKSNIVNNIQINGAFNLIPIAIGTSMMLKKVGSSQLAVPSWQFPVGSLQFVQIDELFRF